MKTKTIRKKDGTVDARFLPKLSAPMIEVPPPTPVTAKDRIQNVIAALDRAIIVMKNDHIYHIPLWSDLNHARTEAADALQKHIDEIKTARANGAQFGI
jgi:hypothetical protein